MLGGNKMSKETGKDLKRTLKTIDNLEDMFKDKDLEVIFGLEELKTQVTEILNKLK